MTMNANIEKIKEHKNQFLSLGIVFMILGVLAISLPWAFTVGFELTVGWLFLLGGLLQFFHVFKSRTVPGALAGTLLAVLLAVVGILLIRHPLQGLLTFTFLLVIFFFIEGCTKIILAFQVRPVMGWGWVFFNGVLGLAIAMMVWAEWPTSAYWLIGLLIGINMLFYGWSQIMLYRMAQKV